MSDTKTITQALSTIWEGSWGSISPSPHSVETVRFCRVKNGVEFELVSYPYRLLTRWSLHLNEPEQMQIEIADEIVVIIGRGLRRIMEALDGAQLQLVQEQRNEQPSGELAIYSIELKSKKLIKCGSDEYRP